MAISDNIKRYRKLQNLTQKQLAEQADIAVITLQQYEAGKRTPRKQQLQNLAKALNVAPNMLILNNSTELDIFEELLALTEWDIRPLSRCDENASCPLTEDERINKYALSIVPDVCETCEYNHAIYFLSNGKKFYKISEEDLSNLQNCILPYLQLRISELIHTRDSYTHKEYLNAEFEG